MDTVAVSFYRLVANVQGGRPDNAEFEYRLVWYAVAAVVLFSLGATILLGAIVWCDLHGHDFGAVRQKNWYTWNVGCY